MRNAEHTISCCGLAPSADADLIQSNYDFGSRYPALVNVEALLNTGEAGAHGIRRRSWNEAAVGECFPKIFLKHVTARLIVNHRAGVVEFDDDFGAALLPPDFRCCPQ